MISSAARSPIRCGPGIEDGPVGVPAAHLEGARAGRRGEHGGPAASGGRPSVTSSSVHVAAGRRHRLAAQQGAQRRSGTRSSRVSGEAARAPTWPIQSCTPWPTPTVNRPGNIRSQRGRLHRGERHVAQRHREHANPYRAAGPSRRGAPTRPTSRRPRNSPPTATAQRARCPARRAPPRAVAPVAPEEGMSPQESSCAHRAGATGSAIHPPRSRRAAQPGVPSGEANSPAGCAHRSSLRHYVGMHEAVVGFAGVLLHRRTGRIGELGIRRSGQLRSGGHR